MRNQANELCRFWFCFAYEPMRAAGGPKQIGPKTWHLQREDGSKTRHSCRGSGKRSRVLFFSFSSVEHSAGGRLRSYLFLGDKTSPPPGGGCPRHAARCRPTPSAACCPGPTEPFPTPERKSTPLRSLSDNAAEPHQLDPAKIG